MGTNTRSDAIRDNITEWLERQPSFNYDPADIVLGSTQYPGETVARSWARVWGVEDLDNDEGRAAGPKPHVITFKLDQDGDILTVRQRGYGNRQAAAIGRGRELLANYGIGDCADAAQDAIVDIMEALAFYGLNAEDALAAARTSWDHDRHQS